MTKHMSHNPLAMAVTLTLASLTTGLAPTTAQAQEAESVLEEVTVTASRREESLQDVAMAVSVLDVNEFIDAGLTGLPDILPFVPGVSVIDSGGAFNTLVFMRGVNARVAAGVTSYLDDIPVGSSTVYTTPAPLDGTLLDLGTLEVLKGPQGTLYGASAIGGILKFNTRKASLDEWSGSLTADLSSTDGGGLNQLYRFNANGPVVSDTLGVSVTAFWKDKTGYIDNVAIGVDNWDDYEYYGGSGSLRWAATDRLEITLQGLYQKSTQNGLATIQANYAQDQMLPGKGPAEPWYGEYQTGEADINPSEYEASVYGLTINYDFDWARLTSVTSTQEVTFVQSADLTVPYAAFADLFFPANAPHTQAIFVGDLGFEKFTQELRLTSPESERFEWIAGAYYNSEDGHNSQELNITPPEEFFFVDFPSNFEELSLFATGTWYFTPDLDASVGIRYADYSNDVELAAVGPLVAPLPFNKIEDSTTNYLFNLRYRVSDTMSVYGRIASGYRPGGANFLLLDPQGNPLSQPYYEPDSLWSYEGGVKGSTADGRFAYDVSLYFIDWQDYIVRISRGGVSVAANADKAESKGLEAALSFAATEALSFTGMVSWTDAQLAADDPFLGAADGTRLPDSPEWKFALNADYSFTLADRPAFVGAAWRYQGDMVVGYPGYTASGVVYEPSNPRVDIDSFNLVDLRAGVTLGAFDLSLYVTNLFNEWAYTSFVPSFVAASSGTPTRPRTFGAVARWNF